MMAKIQAVASLVVGVLLVALFSLHSTSSLQQVGLATTRPSVGLGIIIRQRQQHATTSSRRYAADDSSGELFLTTAHGQEDQSCLLDRRSFVVSVGGAAAAFSALSPAALAQQDKGRIVVFGGSGYVGSHVGQMLSQQGYKVVSVSRSSPADQAAKVSAILGAAKAPPADNIEYVSLDAGTADLSGVLKGAQAVVSCVGAAPGSADQRAGNGAVNVRIADAAGAAGIPRFVYVSVASQVANGPAKFLLGDYFKGKAEAEAAVTQDFGADARLVVKPAIIAGGPPGEIRPPGPPGIKPVAVESVAEAIVAGALGRFSGTLDGNDAIIAAAN